MAGNHVGCYYAQLEEERALAPVMHLLPPFRRRLLEPDTEKCGFVSFHLLFSSVLLVEKCLTGSKRRTVQTYG